MAWKKDLEILKKQMDKEDPPPERKPPPKAAPAPAVPLSMEEQDALFLNAMGMRPKPAQPRPAPAPAAPETTTPGPVPSEPVSAKPTPSAPAEALPPATFGEAMADLKGLVPLRPGKIGGKPIAARRPDTSAAKAPVAATPAPPPEPPAPTPEPVAPEPVVPEPAAHPRQIQLAAGMAVEVDGSLDLKGHSRADAEERLKERLLDGAALGWRTLHLVLGPAEELRAMLLDLLAQPGAVPIARYAQAPIPMGGAQAWILYFRITPVPGTADLDKNKDNHLNDGL